MLLILFVSCKGKDTNEADDKKVEASTPVTVTTISNAPMEEFVELKNYGKEIGFKWVESAPLVRSSYHAGDQVRALSIVHRKLYGEQLPVISD